MNGKYLIIYNEYKSKWNIVKYSDDNFEVVISFDDLANCIYSYLELVG